MKTWIEYDTNTGAILSERLTQDEHFEQKPGVMEIAELPRGTAYVGADGALVRFPERPSIAHEWDWALKQWRDKRTLVQLRAIQWTAIKRAASASDRADIVLQGKTFQADAEARDEILEAAITAIASAVDNVPFSVEWVLQDNTTVTLNAAQMRAVMRAINNRSAQIKAQTKILRDQLTAANTKAEIEAITWSWPP